MEILDYWFVSQNIIMPHDVGDVTSIVKPVHLFT